MEFLTLCIYICNNQLYDCVTINLNIFYSWSCCLETILRSIESILWDPHFCSYFSLYARVAPDVELINNLRARATVSQRSVTTWQFRIPVTYRSKHCRLPQMFRDNFRSHFFRKSSEERRVHAVGDFIRQERASRWRVGCSGFQHGQR